MAPRKSRSHRSESKDRYLALFLQFPLRPLRSEADLDRAISVIDSLLDQERLDPDEEDYLEVLSDLVEKYEAAEQPSVPVTDADMLRYLIEANETTQARVAAGAGIAESTISAILSGKRELSRRHIMALAGFFHVDPGVFVTEPARKQRRSKGQISQVLSDRCQRIDEGAMDVIEKAASRVSQRSGHPLSVEEFISLGNAFADESVFSNSPKLRSKYTDPIPLPDTSCWRAFQDMVAGKTPQLEPQSVVLFLKYNYEQNVDEEILRHLASAFAAESESWIVFQRLVEEAISNLKGKERESAEEN